MRSIKLTTTGILLAAAFVLGGCAAGASSEGEDEGTPTPTAAALKNWCSGGKCTCTGDDDCNDMFSAGVCGEGPKSAICQINSADIPRCRCTAARENTTSSSSSSGGVIGRFDAVLTPTPVLTAQP